MRWLLTSKCPALEQGLKDAGEEVVQAPYQHSFATWMEACDWSEVSPACDKAAKENDPHNPIEYKLGPHLTQQVDVLVIVPFNQKHYGIPLAPVSKWRNGDCKMVVAVQLDEPPDLNQRGCVVRMGLVDVLATNQESVVKKFKSERAVALWSGSTNVKALVEAVKYRRACALYKPWEHKEWR
jgi:hypothetical protein